MTEYQKENRRKFEKVKTHLESLGYTVLTTPNEYKNSTTPLHTICKNGHMSTAKRWADYQRGRECRQCWEERKKSASEVEVYEYIKSLGYEVEPNNRSVIRSPVTGLFLEIDSWVPDKRKAVEYNGDYWHVRYGRNDDTKISYCQDNDISLLIVWDSQWVGDRETTKQRIKDFMESEEHIIDLGSSTWRGYFENHHRPTGSTPLYKATDPNGVEYHINNGMLRDFSKSHDLSYASVVSVVNGYNKQHKGWTFEHLDSDAKDNAMKNRTRQSNKTGINLKCYDGHVLVKDGVTYTFDNIQDFCIEHGLSKSAISLVLKGIRKNHKGFCPEEWDI